MTQESHSPTSECLSVPEATPAAAEGGALDAKDPVASPQPPPPREARAASSQGLTARQVQDHQLSEDNGIRSNSVRLLQELLIILLYVYVN